MHIIWRGQSCFQIIASRQKDGQVSIIIDPFSEELGLKVPKMEADLLLVTHNHYDHNNIKAVSGGPFLINGAGEYEFKGVNVQGIPSFHDDSGGSQRGLNTIYTIEAEEIQLCHLGDFGQKELTPSQLEQIGGIDILIIPVGGTYTIDSKQAAKIINQIEPRVVIPMHYHLPKLDKIKLEGVDKFLKVLGMKTVVSQPKLLIKKKDLPEEEMKIIVLEP